MIELEDNAGDIVGKAQRGLGISDSELGKKSGMSADAVRKARDGQADEATLRAIAPVLDLDPNALVDLAQGQWKPEKLDDFEGLAQFNTSYGGMPELVLNWASPSKSSSFSGFHWPCARSTISRGQWKPEKLDDFEGLAQFNT